jgi:hypothetical protein
VGTARCAFAHPTDSGNDATRAHARHAQVARRAHFPLRCRANHHDAPARPAATRGASRSSRTLEAGCDGRGVLSDEQHDADGEVVWSWRPDAGADLAMMLHITSMTVTTKPGLTGEQLYRRRPVIGRAQGWRCAPPPPAAIGPDPVRSQVCWPFKRSVIDRALWERSLSQCITIGVPFLSAGDHDVEDDDQLAHAGN